MEMDARGMVYTSERDLLLYAFRVASTVGIMMTRVMGPSHDAAYLRAADLAVGMQLTNIARDVGEDARAGRLYLPASLCESVGLDPQAAALEVDEHLRAGPGLWAIGDVTGRGAFTHVSMYQAAICARDILAEPGPVADYRAVPRVTFTDPEVGSVGMTERQAREAGLDVRTALTDLLRTQSWLNHDRINIVVTGGTVQLWGSVRDDEQRRALTVAAESIAGVKSVEDHLTANVFTNDAG